MSVIRGALSGTHPLSEELIGKILDYKYNRDTIEPVQQNFLKELNDLISIQQSAEFPVLSSGSLGIEDLIRPFTRCLKCLKSYHEIGDLPLVRWHYTNTFYRKPRLIARFPEESDVILTDRNALTGISSYSHEALENKVSRIVIPGPVSLVSLIDNGYAGTGSPFYSDINDMIEDAGRFLSQEVAKLPVNYEEIQFDEPALVWKKIPRRLDNSIIQAYEHIRSEIGRRKFIVNTYFENARPALRLLFKLPVDGFGIDLFATNLTNLVTSSFEGKIFQAGIINAKNYLPTRDGKLDHSLTEFYTNLVRLITQLKPEEIILTSNTGLEYLPKSAADACIQQLTAIVKEVQML
ncbi:MAG: hypothetical protein ACFFD4_19970 [Candidatus Odinarchaeota archaeon]